MTKLESVLERKAATLPATAADLPPSAERKRLREALRLTQADVAEIVGGVKAGTVSAWEVGRSEPRGETRERYAGLLSEIKKRLGEEENHGEQH